MTTDFSVPGKIVPVNLFGSTSIASGSSGFISIAAPNDSFGNPRYTCLAGFDIIFSTVSSNILVPFTLQDQTGGQIFIFNIQCLTTQITQLYRAYGTNPIISKASGIGNNQLSIFISAIASGPSFTMNMWGYSSLSPGS